MLNDDKTEFLVIGTSKQLSKVSVSSIKVGKIISSHGSTHNRGVMILFKPRLGVSFEKITTDKYGKYILAEIVIDNTKVVLVNVYAPNDPNQQVVFLRELSINVLSNYGNENLVLGGDF